MQHPSLSINLRIIEDNSRMLVRLCCDKGVIPVGISNLVEGSESIARAMILGGIQTIGDTQLQNLMKLADLPLRRMLLRQVLLSEVDNVVKHTDVSLHTDRVVLEALSQAAVMSGKHHEVVIMHDLNYLSAAGLDDAETENLAELVLTLPGLTLIGIASHLACYGEVEAATGNDNLLGEPRQQADWVSCRNVENLSGAGVAGVVLMVPRNGAPRLTQLRLGSSLIMGIGLNAASIPDMPQSAMSLQAEIIEIKEKSSVYVYSIHADRFDDELQFNDRGTRLRALCAIGKQEVDISQLTPADDGIMIIGATDNVLILDITDADHRYQVGEPLSFHLSYHAVLQCMTSGSVSKHYRY